MKDIDKLMPRPNNIDEMAIYIMALEWAQNQTQKACQR